MIAALRAGQRVGRDPVEVQALAAVYSEGRTDPLVFGAAKACIGHTEGTAGIAGLLKLALGLRAKRCPPVAHFVTLNPNIPPLEAIHAVIPTEACDWDAGANRRSGGVSAFGFSGTNAHVLLQEAARHPPPHCVLCEGLFNIEATSKRVPSTKLSSIVWSSLHPPKGNCSLFWFGIALGFDYG